MHRPPGNRNAGGRGGNGPSRPPPLPDPLLSSVSSMSGGGSSFSGMGPLGSGSHIKSLGKTYRLERKLDEGGMGAVFLATDMDTQGPVVVKFVLKRNLRGRDSSEVENAMARFKREATVAAGVVHPNVIRTLDLGFHDGDPFIVMEYFQGEDLHKIMKRCVACDENGKVIQDPNKNYTLLYDQSGKPLMAWDWLGHVMMEVCEGLNAAHIKQIMHRDIKPGNIMASLIMGDSALRPAKAVKVLDFGLAKFVYEQGTQEELTAQGIIAGTPEYMAPEQVTRAQSGNFDIDHRVDIYALGAVMYRMLTGRSPFSPELDGLLERLNTMPQPPSLFRPDLPPSVDRIILTAMATKREDRYPSAAELKRAIADSLGYSTPQPARTQVSLAEVAPAIHQSKRKGGAGKAIAAVLTVAALSVGGFFAYKHRDALKQTFGLSSKKGADKTQETQEQKGYVVKVESKPSGIPIFRVVETTKMVKGKTKKVEEEIFLGNTPISTVLPPGSHKLRARKKWRHPKEMVVDPSKSSWTFSFY